MNMKKFDYNHLNNLFIKLNLIEKPFVVLDFESSKSVEGACGLPIQIGALHFDKNHDIESISKYVFQEGYNPEIDMINSKGEFKSITDLTGITNAHLHNEEFSSCRITECDIINYGFDKMLIIGYNIPYDVRVLRDVYKRCGAPFGTLGKIEILDVMSIFIDIYGSTPGYIKYGYNRSLRKAHYERYDLNTVAHKLGVASASDEQEHDALSDVQWTLAVLNKIIEEHPGLDYTRYINKIYYNPCYEIPEWQRLSQEGVSYYPFGTKEKLAKVFDQFTLYNYNNFNESDW